MAIHKNGIKCAFAACALSLFAAHAGAQAYVDQTSAGEKDAYINQAPPTAKQVQIPVAPARRTPSIGQKRTANAARSGKNPFPSVRNGSAAIVKTEAEADAWPTVGRGVVNR